MAPFGRCALRPSHDTSADAGSNYTTARIGLGANGYSAASLLHSSGGGAFLTEVILTAVFVLMVLAATRKDASAPVAAVVVGLVPALVNIMGIPIKRVRGFACARQQPAADTRAGQLRAMAAIASPAVSSTHSRPVANPMRTPSGLRGGDPDDGERAARLPPYFGQQAADQTFPRHRPP